MGTSSAFPPGTADGRPAIGSEVLRCVKELADPYADFSTLFAPPAHAVHKVGLRHHRTASAIRASTRRLIGEEGVDAVSLRRVAAICGLSPQTVYNLVGPRDEVIKSAIDEYHTATFSAAHSLTTYPHYLLALTDIVWAQAVHSASFIKSVNACYFGSSFVREITWIQSIRLIRSEIGQTNVGGGAGTPESDQIAQAIFGALAVCAFNWHSIHKNAAQFRRCAQFEIGSILLGMGVDAKGDIRKWTAELERA